MDFENENEVKEPRSSPQDTSVPNHVSETMHSELRPENTVMSPVIEMHAVQTAEHEHLF